MGELPEKLLPALHRQRYLEQSRGAVHISERTPAGSEQRGGTGEVHLLAAVRLRCVNVLTEVLTYREKNAECNLNEHAAIFQISGLHFTNS